MAKFAEDENSASAAKMRPRPNSQPSPSATLDLIAEEGQPRRFGRSTSITVQLVVAIVALVLLTAAAVGYGVYLAVERAIVPQGVQRVAADSRQLASTLVSRNMSVGENLLARSNSGAIAGLIAASTGDGVDPRLNIETATWRRIVEDLFSAELRAKPDYLQFRLIRADGTEYVRVERARPGAPVVALPDAAMQQKQERPYVQETLNLALGEVYLSPLDLNRELGEIQRPFVPVLRYATPINTREGGRWGLLVVNIAMEPTFQALREVVPPQGTLTIINAEGDIIDHADPDLVFGFELGERVTLADVAPAAAAIVAESPSGSGIIETPGGGRVAVGWAEARPAEFGEPLTVVLTFPSRIVRAGPAIRTSAAVVGTVAALIAALIGAMVARAIVRPIVAMSRSLSDAATGHVVHLPVEHGGEIGILARTLTRYMNLERFDSAIINGSFDAILTTAADGRVTRLNPAAESLFEISADDAIGHPLDKVIWWHQPEGEERDQRLALTADEAAVVTIERTARDGSLRVIDLRTSPARAPNGTRIGTSINARDVTADREAQEMFRLSVEHSPAGNLMVDHAGTIVLANAEVERAFGYDRDELIGQNVSMLVPLAAREMHGDFVNGFVAAPARRTMGEDRELYGRKKSGEVFPIEVGLTPLNTRAGPRVLAAVVDVSEHHAAEAALKSRTMELERSNRDLTQFAYVASHDLQEPLRMVASFTQLLSDRYKGQLDEKADRYIHHAVDGAKRMQSLINDLLEYSRVGSGQKPLQVVSSADLWARAQRALLEPIRETSANIETGQLPLVMADDDQLTRVFQNLLSNALKFRGEDPPRVTLTAEREGPYWHFVLTDNGIGFDQSNVEKIFQMFQRLHERSRYGGTGLGLAIVKRIIDQHGGRIWAESEPGRGATFHFTLQASNGDE